MLYSFMSSFQCDHSIGTNKTIVQKESSLKIFFKIQKLMNRIFLGILISIVTQTHKPFYGLTMETRGIPKEVAKDAALTRPRKSTPSAVLAWESEYLHYHRHSDGVVKTVSSFPWEHETPPVTDPLANLWHQAGATGMGLSQHSETMKVETKRPLTDWDPLRQTLLRAGTVGRRECCLSLCIPAYWAGCQI